MGGGELEKRLAEVAAQMLREGLVQSRQDDGWPWAFTVSGAAGFLGVSQQTIEKWIATKRIHVVQLAVPMISATQIRRILREQHR